MSEALLSLYIRWTVLRSPHCKTLPLFFKVTVIVGAKYIECTHGWKSLKISYHAKFVVVMCYIYSIYMEWFSRMFSNWRRTRICAVLLPANPRCETCNTGWEIYRMLVCFIYLLSKRHKATAMHFCRCVIRLEDPIENNRQDIYLFIYKFQYLKGSKAL